MSPCMERARALHGRTKPLAGQIVHGRPPWRGSHPWHGSHLWPRPSMAAAASLDCRSCARPLGQQWPGRSVGSFQVAGGRTCDAQGRPNMRANLGAHLGALASIIRRAIPDVPSCPPAAMPSLVWHGLGIWANGARQQPIPYVEPLCTRWPAPEQYRDRDRDRGLHKCENTECV